MNPTTGCPCGSGKPQIQCCGAHPKSKINLRLLVTWTFIILVGCGIAAIAFSRPQDDAPGPAAGPTPALIQPFNNGAPVTSSTSPSLTNPQPWQYDPATNQHWNPNPGHVHWHSGPPPTNPVTSPLGSSATSGTKVPSPPDIPNPQPWQYDAATYSHYDPNHAHWHSGLPPNDSNAPAVSGSVSGSEVSAPLNITNPSPWQYDVVSDRHYDPNHLHWHSGRPPAK